MAEHVFGYVLILSSNQKQRRSAPLSSSVVLCVRWWNHRALCFLCSYFYDNCLIIQEVHRMSFEYVIFVWHTKKYNNTPTIVDAFKCRDHGLDATSAFDSTIHASISHFNNNLLYKFVMILGAHELNDSEVYKKNGRECSSAYTWSSSKLSQATAALQVILQWHSERWHESNHYGHTTK